ncbi:MAG: protein translocase subunit SecD [Alphaproteobacteria bacterium]|nr:protein translocase subunit SecD [Alphaproteobacteria bacterium]
MLYFAKWKIALVVALCSVGIFFAVPNVLSHETTAKMPSWWQPVNLGLDLQGGSHLLLEVDVKAVLDEQLNNLLESVRSALRQAHANYRGLGIQHGYVSVTATDTDARESIRKALHDIERTVQVEEGEGGTFRLHYSEEAVHTRQDSAVQQSIEIVRRRIDELGTREPSIQRQGANRIIVELPGLDDPDRVKRLLGKTAKLTLHLVDEHTPVSEALSGHVPPGSELVPSAESKEASHYVLRKRVEIGGDMLTDSQPTLQDGQPVVSFRFDTLGGKKFARLTQENTGKLMAIVLDGKVISAPVIREPILGGSGVISGSFTVQSAQDLALLLRAGALPAPLKVMEERTVGPGLGADSIHAGAVASVLGFVLVVVFMVVAYGLFGLFADLALILNLTLLVGVLTMLGATLTLPGIAGMVLTMGMAVDANVLIYERMREEFRLGRTPLSAMEAGFKRAFTTIVDANVTTLIASILLFQFGTGPVRGFAVALGTGLTTSLFTAVMVTRLMVVLWVRRYKPQTLPV